MGIGFLVMSLGDELLFEFEILPKTKNSALPNASLLYIFFRPSMRTVPRRKMGVGPQHDRAQRKGRASRKPVRDFPGLTPYKRFDRAENLGLNPF